MAKEMKEMKCIVPSCNTKEKSSTGNFRKFYKCSHFQGELKAYEETGHYPYCRDCLNSMILDDNGQIDQERFLNVLKLLDKPYYTDLYDKMLTDSRKGKIGVYLSYISGNDTLKDKRWTDGDTETKKEKKTKDLGEMLHEDLPRMINQREMFLLRQKYGHGYSEDEYVLFEKKYRELEQSIPDINNTFQEECFRDYCIAKVKESVEKSKNNIADAKQWAKMASDASTRGGFNPSQLTVEDKDSIDCFSVLSLKLEQHDKGEVVGLLPHYIEKPKDNIDIILYYFILYVRGVLGMDNVPYKDIYKFYLEREMERTKTIDEDFFSSEREKAKEELMKELKKKKE